VGLFTLFHDRRHVRGKRGQRNRTYRGKSILPVCCVSLCDLPSVCSGSFHHCLDTAGGEPPSAGLRGIYAEYCSAGNLFAGDCASGHVESGVLCPFFRSAEPADCRLRDPIYNLDCTVFLRLPALLLLRNFIEDRWLPEKSNFDCYFGRCGKLHSGLVFRHGASQRNSGCRLCNQSLPGHGDYSVPAPFSEWERRIELQTL